MSADGNQIYSYKLNPSSSANGMTKSEFVLSCNFDQLASTYPEFQTTLSNSRLQNASHSNFSLDSSTEFNKALTRCLLRHHFNLQLPSLPEGRLCPPIPNRANYVRWLRELISSSSCEIECFSGCTNDEISDNNQIVHQTESAKEEKTAYQHQGIDIGTGVSAIYPLLLTTELFAKSEIFREIVNKKHGNQSSIDTPYSNQTQNGNYKILATDIDPIAVESARANVKANNLDEQICVVQVSNNINPQKCKNGPRSRPNGPLYAAMLEAQHNSMFQLSTSSSNNGCHPTIIESDTIDLSTFPRFDFVMTNPPFYSTAIEATSPRAGDKRPRTKMSSNEAVYKQSNIDTYNDDEDITDKFREGGDVGFISDIMKDSQFFRNHITWYTSLVAKRTSLDTILRQLQTLDGVWGNRGQIRTVEFRQGSSSQLNNDKECYDESMRCSLRVRWGIAWTYARAIARCGFCKITSGLTCFSVSLDEDDITLHDTDEEQKSTRGCKDEYVEAYCNEVVSRLRAYVLSFRKIPLRCKETTKNQLRCVTIIEERFTEDKQSSILNHEDDNANLPYEGHFVLDVYIKVANNHNNEQSTEIEVSLDMYSHTKRGINIIDTIRGPMPGEIRRTNRRWRRLKKNTNVK